MLYVKRMTALLENSITGETVKVYSTTDHNSLLIWVDETGKYYGFFEEPIPNYRVIAFLNSEDDIELIENWKAGKYD